MRDRWRPVVVLATVLFAVNVVARLTARFGYDGETEVADRISLGMFVVIGVILASVAFVWGRRHPAAQWIGDMSLVVLIAMVLTVFVGPFISGSHPFADGAGAFFSQIWLYAAFTGGGALVGYLLVTALGWDYRSQWLRRYAQTRQAKPRRVVRR